MRFHSSANSCEALGSYWQTSLSSDSTVFSFCMQSALFCFSLGSDFDKFDLADLPENFRSKQGKEILFFFFFLHSTVFKLELIINVKGAKLRAMWFNLFSANTYFWDKAKCHKKSAPFLNEDYATLCNAFLALKKIWRHNHCSFGSVASLTLSRKLHSGKSQAETANCQSFFFFFNCETGWFLLFWKKKSREKLLKSLSLSRRCNLIGVSVCAIWITVLSTGWVWFARTAARKQYVKRGSFAPFICSTFRTKQDNDRHFCKYL